MPFEQREIAGYTCNLQTSKDGRWVRSCTILLGSDSPGYRRKDGFGSRKRKAIKKIIEKELRNAGAIEGDKFSISCVAVYSCLVQVDNHIERRGDSGHVIGIHFN